VITLERSRWNCITMVPPGSWTKVAPIAFAALAAGSIVFAAVAAPLLVYSITLASFGAAHVLSELRYVDLRFGHRFGKAWLWVTGALLAGAVMARVSGIFGFLNPATAITLELSFVVALALSAAHGGALPQRMLAVGVGCFLGLATLASPFDTAITLSILHNLTPLAFLWELSPARSRGRIMTLASIAFVGVPLLVATGLPRVALAALGVVAPSIDPLGAGALADHLYVYVPLSLQAAGSAIDLFSASVVAQCAHYIAVILILPAMLSANNPSANGIVAWPRARMFSTIVVALASIVLYRFATGFVSARALYGIAASVHAWIEIPLVVIAITGRSYANKISPVSAEAALATAETASARGDDSPLAQAMIAASTRITTASPQPTAGQ
jgi:hypothetical protein